MKFPLGGWRGDLYNNSARRSVAQFTLALVHVGSEISFLEVSRSNLSDLERNNVQNLGKERERERERGTSKRKVEKYDCSRRNVEKSYLRKQYLFTTLFPSRSKDLSFQTINYFQRRSRATIFTRFAIYQTEMKNIFREVKASIGKPTFKK